jgi:hypothetical protein
MNFEFSDKADYQEYFGRAHNMVRRSVKEFVDKEIMRYRLSAATDSCAGTLWNGCFAITGCCPSVAGQPRL